MTLCFYCWCIPYILNTYKLKKKKTVCAVVTWGDKGSGGDSSSVQTALRGVDKIYSTGHAFAAAMTKKGGIKLAITDSNC